MKYLLVLLFISLILRLNGGRIQDNSQFFPAEPILGLHGGKNGRLLEQSDFQFSEETAIDYGHLQVLQATEYKKNRDSFLIDSLHDHLVSSSPTSFKFEKSDDLPTFLETSIVLGVKDHPKIDRNLLRSNEGVILARRILKVTEEENHITLHTTPVHPLAAFDSVAISTRARRWKLLDEESRRLAENPNAGKGLNFCSTKCTSPSTGNFQDFDYAFCGDLDLLEATACLELNRELEALNFNYDPLTGGASNPSIPLIGAVGLSCDDCFARIGVDLYADVFLDVTVDIDWFDIDIDLVSDAMEMGIGGVAELNFDIAVVDPAIDITVDETTIIFEEVDWDEIFTIPTGTGIDLVLEWIPSFEITFSADADIDLEGEAHLTGFYFFFLINSSCSCFRLLRSYC